ncbi:type II toxin-antitoxin system prevent-host-death family antitoxin [Mycobacterium tuberculosis]|nr:type II toxin-antitoxin system prevent-host-death family antitoxin [Mycobacterium tuberculosis]
MIAKFGEQVVDAKVWAPAKRVGVHEAKTRLSELLRLVYGGQRLRLPPHETRRLGIDHGVYRVPDDLDAPLSDDVLERFHR